ncbi:MAG: GNAT family N-acetyltransferase [Oscillospiraceae bacterium]|jgi:GNAT superfamily N-acetyltransferase|nr:GNAT family N-acetyltransferase [Oscillospiraceae bacterium]
MTFEAVRATAAADLAEELGAVHAASWRAAYRGLVPDAFLDTLTAERRTVALRAALPLSRDEFYLFRAEGAAAGAAILGACRSGGGGELHALYFLPVWWGTPHTGAAMAFCLARLAALGHGAAILWTLEDNPRARRFYEKHGFALTGEREIIQLGAPLWMVKMARSLA